MISKQCIILGGGYTVKEGLEKGLFDWLPNSFCIGLNYSYKFIQTTALSSVDTTFYQANKLGVDKVPLHIAKMWAGQSIANNTITLKACLTYNRDLTGGVYSSTLAGLFALSLMIKVLDVGEIYCLGFDYGVLKDDNGNDLVDEKGKLLTHWYQGQIEHRGVSRVNWFKATMIDPQTRLRITQAEREFRVYRDEKKVKIYIVGKSNIPDDIFKKISYDEFFKLNENNRFNQDELREELKKEIWKLKNEKGL